MASSSEVRAILSLPPPTAGGPSAPRKSHGTLPGKGKPDGISRELYSLIGNSAPTLVAQYARPKFKPKLGALGKARGSKWLWSEFENPARSDGLKLKHWTRVGEETSDAGECSGMFFVFRPDVSLTAYPFAKYNVPTAVMSYSHDDYMRYLQGMTFLLYV